MTAVGVGYTAMFAVLAFGMLALLVVGWYIAIRLWKEKQPWPAVLMATSATAATGGFLYATIDLWRVVAAR